MAAVSPRVRGLPIRCSPSTMCRRIALQRLSLSAAWACCLRITIHMRMPAPIRSRAGCTSDAIRVHFVEGLHLMGNPRPLGLTAAISLLYLALQILSVFALMRAYGLD